MQVDIFEVGRSAMELAWSMKPTGKDCDNLSGVDLGVPCSVERSAKVKRFDWKGCVCYNQKSLRSEDEALI